MGASAVRRVLSAARLSPSGRAQWGSRFWWRCAANQHSSIHTVEQSRKLSYTFRHTRLPQTPCFFIRREHSNNSFPDCWFEIPFRFTTAPRSVPVRTAWACQSSWKVSLSPF